MSGEIGKVYLSRVITSASPFNAATAEDLTAFSAVFSQVKGDAGSINITCLNPSGGLMSGPRWGVLAVEVDGVLEEIARGEMVGFPLKLAGQEVDIEFSCKSASATILVDSLHQALDDLVPYNVEPSTAARRTAPYILSDPYIDPVTLVPTLDPIAGSAAPVMTLYGEGADPDVSTILSIDIDFTDAPASSVTINETTAFDHQVFSTIDLGSALNLMSGLDRIATYTPETLRDGISKITLDGGYDFLSASISFSTTAPLVVYTKKRSVDPFTCIITPAQTVEYLKNEIDDISIKALVEAVQDREETLTFDVIPKIAYIGGEVTLSEETALQNAEELAKTSTNISYSTYRKNYGIGPDYLSTLHNFTRNGVSESIWKNSAGGMRTTCHAAFSALARLGARVAVERAHCVTLTVQTFGAEAMRLTLKDRVRIFDVRLPGGVAVGKITGREVSFSGSSCITTLSIACPISDASDLSSSVIDVTDGLANVSITHSLLSASAIHHSSVMNSVMNANANNLVDRIALTNDYEEQEGVLGATDAVFDQIEFPDNVMPKTGIEIELADLSPVDFDTLPAVTITAQSVIVRLPEGITL